MLLLRRKVGETIIIGDDIVIEVVAIVRGNTVQLGITADPSIPVDRAEIRDKIAVEGRRPRQPKPPR